MNSRDLLNQFLSDKSNRRYALPIFERLIQAIRHGEIAKIRKMGREELLENMPKIFNRMKDDALKKNRYVAHLFPTIISPEQAPNFYIGKEVPTEEEIYNFFYILISGLYRGPYIVNLVNADEKLMKRFREDLINENLLIFPEKGGSGINTKEILNKLGIRISPQINEFIFSFIVISYFICWIKKMIYQKTEVLNELGLEDILENIGINDDVALIVAYIPKQKKEIYYVPKIKNFFLTWYKDYLEGKEEFPSVVKFIFSTYIADEQYREISSSLLNKFLYYFLNGYVNGDLLNKLINLKIYYELKQKSKKQVYGFSAAKQFFSTLSRNI